MKKETVIGLWQAWKLSPNDYCDLVSIRIAKRDGEFIRKHCCSDKAPLYQIPVELSFLIPDDVRGNMGPATENMAADGIDGVSQEKG